MPAHTVVVAGRDPRTRARICSALEGHDVRVLAQAAHRWECGELVRSRAPAVVVVDVSLLSIREFFLTGWGPVSRGTRIVAVGPDDPHLARLLLTHGVAAYVPVSRLADELPECVTGAAGTAGTRP